MKKIKTIVTTILLLAAISIGSGKALIDYKLNDTANQWVTSTNIEFNYADLFLNLQGNVVVKQANFQLSNLEKITIDELIIHQAYQFYLSQGLPEKAYVTAHNIKMNILDVEPPPPPLLSALGYAPYYLTPHALKQIGLGNINANLELTTTFVAKRLQVLMKIDAEQWGNWEANLDLNELQNLNDWQSSYLQALVVTYVDKGLIESIFNFLAQRNQAFLPEFKQAFLVKLKTDATRANIQLDPTVLASVQQLVHHPRQLTIKLIPTYSVRLNQLTYSTPQRLGLTMSTN